MKGESNEGMTEGGRCGEGEWREAVVKGVNIGIIITSTKI